MERQRLARLGMERLRVAWQGRNYFKNTPRGKAGCGHAWLGTVWQGTARHCKARLGRKSLFVIAPHGWAWRVLVWRGRVRQGEAGLGCNYRFFFCPAGQGAERNGLDRLGTARQGRNY